VQREKKGVCRATARRLVIRARETDRERGSSRVKETGTDKSAPLGSEREREGVRERELSLIGRVRLSGDAGTRARGLAGLSGPTGLLSLFLFL
jgi:hypothetical protein